MSDVETIFVVLGLLYLYEGGALPTGAARTFGSAWGKLLKPRPAEGLWGNESRSVHLSPISPMGAMLVAEHWPVSIGPEGVLGFNVSAPGTRFRPIATERFVPFDPPPRFRSDGAKLIANGALLARTTRPELAAWLAGVLEQAATLTGEARAAALEQRIGSAFQIAPCRQRGEQVQKESYWARFSSAVGFAWVFIGGLGYYYLVKDDMMVLRLLLGFLSVALVVWIWALVEFYIAHKKLYPSRKGERFKMTVEGVLPPTAMRSYFRLAYPALAAWNPLTVAAVVCNEDDLEFVAREFLRDLENPLRPFGEGWSEAALRTEAWHRERVKHHAQALLAEVGVDLAEIMKPPATLDPLAAAWCPRCEREFGSGVAACEDCGGIELVKFDGAECT